MSDIGFIGLGNMGGRMARRIVNAGTHVLGFDPQPGAAAAARTQDADSAADVARSSDTIFLSLPDSHVVEAVALGEHGVIANAREGSTIVDLSTSSPTSTRRLHGIAQERGLGYVDAGISGGAAAAESGTLTLMVGGDPDRLDSVRDTMGHFASNIFHIGESGAGHTTKLLNNFLNAVALSATAEVMVAARKAGLDLTTVLDVFNKSSGVNFATLNRFPKIVQGDYLQGGLTNTLMMKDIVLYSELISDLGVAGVNASGPLAAFGLARQLGYADRISNTVVDAIGDVSGGIRLHDQEEGAS